MSQFDEMKKGIDDLAKDADEMKKGIDDLAKDSLEMKKWIDDHAKDSLEKTDALEAQIKKLNTYLLPPAAAADAADAERRPGGFSRDTVRRFETLKGMFESVETHEGGDFYFSFAMMDGRVYVQHVKGHYDVRWVGGRGVESFGLRMDPGEEVWGPYHVH
jgi:hypothetical protein